MPPERAIAKLVLLGTILPALARADPLLPTPEGTGGYGGPVFAISSVAGKPAILGGGPLLTVMPSGRLALGLDLIVTEGDVDGLSLASLSAHGELELARVWRVRLGAGLAAGGWLAARERADRSLLRSAALGVEPQLRLTFDLFDGTRLSFFGGYRLTGGPGSGPDRDLGGWVLGLQLQDGVFPDAPDTSRWHLVSSWAGKLTTVAGAVTFLDGGGTRLSVDDTWAVGIGGFVPRSWFSGSVAESRLAYFNLTGEYLFRHGSAIRPSLALAAGLGGFSRAGAETQTGVMAVIEPSAGLQLTVTRYLRACAGVGYRATPCVSCPEGIASAQGAGPVAELALRFGGGP